MKNDRKVEVRTPHGSLVRLGMEAFARIVVALRHSAQNRTNTSIAQEAETQKGVVAGVKELLRQRAEAKRRDWEDSVSLRGPGSQNESEEN